MALIVRDGPNRLSEAELQAVEKRLGLDLPSDYRAFLLKHNGGEPEPRWFGYPELSEDHDGAEFGRIDFFHSVVLPTPAAFDVHDFERAVRHFRSELELPKKYVPVGVVQEDIIVLGCKAGERGRIYYWSNIESGFDTSFFAQVTDSWDAFLSSLAYPPSAPWMELIDRGDVEGVKRWLAEVGKPKEVDEKTGFSPWEYADFACQLEVFDLLSR